MMNRNFGYQRSCSYYCLLLFLLSFTTPLKALEHVSVRLQWKHQFEFAGFYAAIENGFYREAGFEVTLHEYEDGVDQIDEVTDGQVTFGIWNEGIIQAYMEGKPVVLLANYFKQSPLIIVSKTDIKTPADLSGRSLMISSMDIKSTGLIQMLSRFDISAEDVKLVPPSFDIEDFINGSVDAYLAFSTNEPYELKQWGTPYNTLSPSDYGIDLYDVNLFTSQSYAERNPERVVDFVEATNRGWVYALDHPEEIIELIIKNYNTQNKSRGALQYEMEVTRDVMQSDRYPIGSIDPKRIQLIGDIFSQNGLVNEVGDYEGFIFNPYPWHEKLGLTEEERRFIKEHPKVILGTDPTFEPYVIRNPDGSVSGHDAELVQIINDRTGLQIEITLDDWSVIQKKAETREIDGLITAAYDKSRLSYMNPTEPYLFFSSMIFVKSGNPKKINSINDLAGKRAAHQRDNLLFERILKETEKNIELIVYDDIYEQISAVINEEADFFIYDETTYYIARTRGLSGTIEPSFTLGTPFEVLFWLRKDRPELQSVIDKVLASIDVHEKITLRDRWFGHEMLKGGQSKQTVVITTEERAYLEQKGEITMCVDPDWMPMERLGEGGRHEGISEDILEISQERSGVRLRVVPTRDWDESIGYAKTRKCDILSLAMATPSRKKFMDFTSPYINFPLVIATRTEEIFIESIESVEDKPLAMVNGYAVIELLKNRYPHLKIIEVDNVVDGLKTVQDGNAYGYVDALAPVAYTLQQEGLANVKIAGKFDENWELSIGARNDEPLLLPIMQKMIDTVSEEEKRNIYNRWYSVKFEQGVNYKLVMQVTLAALIIIAMMILWNRQISNERRRTADALVGLRNAQELLEEKNQQLQQQATTDPLTGLFNRSRIDDVLTHEKTRVLRYGSNLGIIILDIDHFKRVNDTFGHQVGDKVLVKIAKLLHKNSRSIDTVGRWGGEEFLIICPGATLDGLQGMAEKLRKAVAATEYPKVGSCSASFGIAVYDSKETLHELVLRADEALYRAKMAGRNRVEVG